MNTALLVITGLSLVSSVTTLAILGKTVHELNIAKAQIEKDVEVVKTKVNHNAKVVKAALGAMEF